MREWKVYLDMDGVLADFDRGIAELCGLPRVTQGTGDKAADEKMWEEIRKTDHFYDRLELMPDAEKLFRLLSGQYGVRLEILTGIPKKKRGIVTAGDDKISWVRRKLSEDIPVHIVYKEEKKDYCTGEECVLIDDLSRNIEEWEANGGTGILFTSADDAIKVLREKGVLFPEEIGELVEIWKEKKETYREGFNYGWPAKLVKTRFIFEGKKYSIFPETLGLDKYDPFDHGLMEYFQSDLTHDLKEIGATDIFNMGFLD